MCSQDDDVNVNPRRVPTVSSLPNNQYGKGLSVSVRHVIVDCALQVSSLRSEEVRMFLETSTSRDRAVFFYF